MTMQYTVCSVLMKEIRVFGELLGLEPVSLVITSRLRWNITA